MFQKKEWKPRQVQFPGRRILRNVDTDEEMTVIVDRDEGEVTQEGDSFSSATMNDLEQRIADAVEGVVAPQIIVTAPEGSEITVTNGELTMTAVGGTVAFDLSCYGEWTVSSTLNGETDSEVVVVDTVKQYYVTLSYLVIFGISRDTANSSPLWTRTDDAVGMTATASIGTSAGSSDFDQMAIYRDIERVTMDNGDVMVKIPAFWYQRYKSGNTEYIRIADREADGFELHPAFARPSGNVDYIYVGAYKTGTGHVSKTGLAPLTNITRAAFRTGARGKGDGWGLIDIAAVSAVQMLMLVEFATNNVQSAIGSGYSNESNSAAINTGSCDGVPNLTGRPSGTADKVDVVWRGIEGFWGNVWEWTDGLNFNGGTYYVCNDPTKYADDTSSNYKALSYKGATDWSSSYITQEGLDTANPWCMMPSAAGSGSGSTYFTDGVWSSTGWRVFERGGRWNSGTICGLFTTFVASASSSAHANCGSRLLYIPS